MLERAQSSLHFLHGLEALVGVLTQATMDYVLQLRRRIGSDFRNWPGFIAQDRRKRRKSRIASKRPGPGHPLVQHHSKREDVGAGVYFLTLGLLRRHVTDSSDDGSFHGQRRFGDGASGV